MTADRRDALVLFIKEQLGVGRRRVRNLCLTMLVLCAIATAILVSVRLDGAEGSEDMLVPTILTAALALFAGAFTLWSLRSLERHDLVRALRASPPRIDRVERRELYARGASDPALSFRIDGGGEHIVVMAEMTRAEFIGWLAR